MQFVARRKELLTALQGVQGVVEKKNTMPILSHILICAEEKGIRVFATDLEVGIQGFYPARVAEEGRVALSARKLYEITRELPEEEVKVATGENNWVTLESGKSRFRITGLPADEFPSFPTPPADSFFEVDGNGLADLIRRTLFAAGENDARYILNGILFSLKRTGEKSWALKLVGTDGHRLAIAETNMVIENPPFQEKEISVIIPKKGILEMKKILEDENEGAVARLAVSKGQLTLERGNLLLVARLMEGNYPNYQQVIPKDNNQRASVKKLELQGALRRVSILAREKTNAIRLTVGKGRMLLSSNNPEMGEAHEEMEARYPGEEIITGFNARYLLDALEAHEGEDVVLEFKDPLSPCLIREEEKKYLCVVMPMRV
jgi:DNA polymerase-3 subunit beta